MARRTSLAAARAELDGARAEHATADTALDVARAEHEKARAALFAARKAYGDAPDTKTETELDGAKRAASLARLRSEGAARKLDAATATLDAARAAEARATLAHETPRCERAPFFDALAPQIKACARLAIALPVDIYQGTDRALAAALARKAARELEHARAVRIVRAAVLAQHASVAEVQRASATLRQDAPRSALAIPESHVMAAIELEAYALRPTDFDSGGGPTTRDAAPPGRVDQDRWTEWAGAAFGVLCYPAPPMVSDLIPWGRDLYLTGVRPRPVEVSAADRETHRREEEAEEARERAEEEEAERAELEDRDNMHAELDNVRQLRRNVA